MLTWKHEQDVGSISERECAPAKKIECESLRAKGSEIEGCACDSERETKCAQENMTKRERSQRKGGREPETEKEKVKETNTHRETEDHLRHKEETTKGRERVHANARERAHERARARARAKDRESLGACAGKRDRAKT